MSQGTLAESYDLQLVKVELLEAIKYFVKREELVAQALKDFGLDLHAVAILGAGGWTTGAEGAKQLLYEGNPNYLSEGFRYALQRMIERKTLRVNQTGSWQDNNGEVWNYFMHGGGCRLSNPATGEVIDWDCPNVIHFDVFKFGIHLNWQIEKFPEKYANLKKLVSNTNMALNQLIAELVTEGKLVKDPPNHYRVL